MRVLFTSQAAVPHLYPMVPLAWAVRSAGHEVRIASAPRVLDQIVHTGLPAVVVGTGPKYDLRARRELVSALYSQDPWPRDWAVNPQLLGGDQLAHITRVARALMTAAAAMVDDLVAFSLDWRPDVIVYDSISYAGAVAAAVLDVPSVRNLCGLAALPRLERRWPDGKLLPEYVRLFERFDVAVLTEAATVDPVPPSMALARDTNRLDVRYVPYNGPGVVPDWLGEPAPRPRICVTWGHTAANALGDDAAQPYRAAVEAIADLDVEILVITTAEQIELLGVLPGNARAEASVPLQLVLPHCAAIVHQGGDGTTFTAAVAGVPQLGITRKPDAELGIGRLDTIGAGVHLPFQRLRDDPARAEVIRGSVDKLVSDSAYREAANLLRAEIESRPPPSKIVPALVALADSGGVGGI